MKSANASIGARALDRLRDLVWLYVALIAVGLVAVALKSRVVRVDSWPVQPSASSIRNLAHLTAGTRMTASSHHAEEKGVHPLYAIDGDPKPPLRWASEPRDQKPWLHFKLAKVSHLTTFQLEHTPGAHQQSPRGYTLTCFKRTAGILATVAESHVTDDDWKGTMHPCDCKGITEVRIQFDASKSGASDSVGLYEVTLMGSVP